MQNQRNINYLQRSDNKQITVIKLERKGNLIKRTEYTRAYVSSIESDSPSFNLYIKLENEWNQKEKF